MKQLLIEASREACCFGVNRYKERVPVRIATINDVHAIARVHVTSWQTSYRGIVPDDLLDGLSVERRAEQWSGRFKNPSEKFPLLVAESDGEVVGFAAYGPFRDEDAPPGIMELYAIYLLQDCQRRGLGRELWVRALDEMRKEDVSSVTVWVLEDNVSARRFYENMGFVEEGISKELTMGSACLNELRYRLEV